MKDEILFISTIHRMSERVIPAINKLQSDFNVKILNSGQSSFNTEYRANHRYKKYVKSNFSKNLIFNTPAISHKREARDRQNSIEILSIAKDQISDRTVAVILDDSRHKIFSKDLYKVSKNNGCKVFANSHGNASFERIMALYGLGVEKFYDHIFVFGDYERNYFINSLGIDKNMVISGGIPENDSLKNAQRENNYILVLPNFILEREIAGYKIDYSDHALSLNKHVIEKMKIHDLQQKLGKKVLIKLKHRMSSPCEEEIDSIKKIIPKGLECDIIHHVNSEKDLISKAACVFTYGSTMTFKPIQLEIPTVIYKELGYIGNFANYPGVISLEDSYDHIFDHKFNNSNRDIFLKDTISGGYNFSSTDVYTSSFLKKIYS